MPESNRHARLVTTLQGIFGRVLRIEPRDVDPEAPFLELGADSLALVEALRGIQQAYGVKLTIRQLFEQLPSISVLATFLGENVQEAVAASEEALITPALFSQPPPLPPGEEGGVSLEKKQKQIPANPSPPLPDGGGEAGRGGARGGEGLGSSAVERLLAQQIQAFNQLVAQQLQALGARGAAVRPPVPPPPAVPAPSPSPTPVAKPVLPTHLGKIRPAAEMSERQRRHLDALIERYTRKTAKSKALTEAYRPWLADSRATVGFRPVTKEMLYPLARHRSRGSRLWDVDGNEYVDVTMGMGVHLFGHDPEFLRETIARQVAEGFELGPRSAHSGEVAALFCELTGMERATFTNSGTEACMTAIRLARARTGRTKIVLFAGSYHGHSDGTLAQTQEIDGELRSFPVAPGVPPKVAEDVLVLDYGTPEALEIIRKHRHELAAVMVEPIQSRRPEVQPREFLHELRRLTAESGIALIFDEMICGFRLHLGGAQAHFGVRADLATYGKIVGGGLPIGVVAGAAEYMDGIDGGPWRYGDDSRPERETTFFGGTFCQHPLAMAAAKRVLTYLKEQGPGLQEALNKRTARFAGRLNELFASQGAPLRAVHAHSLFRFQSAANVDLLYYHLVDQGVYVWEWRNCFLSTAHTDADLDFVVRAVDESVAEMQRGGFLPEPPAGGGGGGGKTLGFWDRQGKPAIAPVMVDRTDRTDPTDPSDATAKGREVRFSLYFFGNYPAEFRAGKYDLLFEAARFADRHGFSALWFPERHFHPFGGLSPNPSVLAAALARETERIALRAGSVVLPLQHPLRVAEEWALVDNLSGGRVGLSYASGWHPNDFALAPEAYGRHRELTFERIEEVRRLWRGEALRVRDGAGQEVDLRIFPRPARRDLPEWLTIVNNPDTYGQAGRMGVGVLTNLMGQTVEGLAAALRTYREALAAAGHPPEKGHVTLLLHTCLDPDAALAVERARRPFYDYLKSSAGLLRNMMASEGITTDLASLSPEDLEYVLEMAFQRYVRTSALIGSPESCAPIVERLRAAGVDEIACLIDFGVEPALVAAGLPWLDALKDRFREADAQPAPAPAIEAIELPLTEAQSDLYTVAQLGVEALMAYNEAGVLELRGPLDLALLRRALQREVDRHEALRTVFPPPGEAQAVLPPFRLEVPLLDAASCPEERREEVAAGWLEALARTPFDLARGPLLRAAVLRLDERRHLLSVAVHHLAADGLSLGIVLGEAFAGYEAERAGRRPALSAPMQFREYAAWLATTQTPERLATDEAYWLAELAGELPVFEPPTDRPRPPLFTYRGRRQRTVLGAADRDLVQRFGRRHGATLYVTLLAAYTALLHRWTGQDDLIVGSPTARRPLAGGDRLVGHCTDLVALRSRLDELGNLGGDRSFTRHLAAVRARVLGAHDHGELSFARLVQRLQPRRDPGRSPLVNVVFNLDPDWGMDRAGGLEIAERSPAMPYVKFDLALHALQTTDGLVIQLDSRRDLFDAATIDRLAGRLQALLAGVLEDPGRPLGEIPWLTAADRRQLVAEVSVPYPRERTVHELFAEVAAERPDAVAVEQGDRCLTYAELDALAGDWARRLRDLGVGPEARVATVLERSPELIAAWLATLKAGGAYVPLDPGFPEERIERLLAGSGAVVVVTGGEERRDLAGCAVRTFNASLVCTAHPASSDLEAEVTPDSLAYVTYTSGSTGEPKGVAIPHRAVVRLVREADYARLGPDDRVAHLSHVAFDAATFEVWGPLLNGGRVVILDRDTALAPARLAAALRDHEVTVLFLTTALFNQMAQRVAEEPAAFAGLRHLLTGGEAADPDRFRAVLSGGAPTQLIHVYGPTECTTFALWEPVTAVPAGEVSLPIGRPVANTRACLLDRAGVPVPPGVDGELCLGGDGLARGYLGRPDLTAERFVPDPLGQPGARLYRTGDRARMRLDGRIDFLGRLDRQVKIRGFRVEPGEIEAALARCPGVRECAVVTRREGDGLRLVAYVVTAEGAEVDPRAFLRERLPAAMIPADFVILPALPLTPSGKVDRRALPAPVADDSGRGIEAPRDPVEQIVAGAWSEALGRERIGLRESFFDLGGHSLLAGRVLSRLRAALGVDLPLSDFFQDPTLAGLARRVEAARRERQGVLPPPLRRVPRTSRLRLSFAQERLWLLNELQPGTAAYNSPFPTSLQGRLDVPALARVLAEIQRRHEVLRTRFVRDGEGPALAIAPESSLDSWFLPVVDLGELSADRREAELSRLTAAEAGRPFDLARGPLLRATLVRVAERQHGLLLNLHHTVCDGWSLEVMTRELAALYRAFAAGRPSPLPELPFQYADFAQWQRQWLQGEVVAAQLAWWRQRLGDSPPPLALPTDRPRPPLPAGRGESQGLVLPAELAARLAALARRQGATPFIALLAGFQALLHRLSRQERIAVGTPVAGRTRVEVEGLIGLFVNTLVLAADFPARITGAGLLDRVRDSTLGAFDHQDLPFEQLVAALARDRDPSRHPLFQAMFVLQNNARPEVDLRDLTLTALPGNGAGALFDLTLGALELEDGGIGCGITCAADLFDPATIRRWLEQYRLLLEALVENPGQVVDEVPLGSTAERHQVTVDPAALEEARRAELARRRSEVASRRGQLSADRRALLRQWVGGGAAAPANPGEEPPAKVSPLVEFQTAGGRPPFFLVHAAGGLVHDYVNLARRLDPDQPFYGLQSPALAGGEHFASVPEMAARYVAAVRSVQPRGPYRLGGYCVGGGVAFEMARQLRAAGEEVESLLLFDSPGPPAEPPPPPPVDEAEMLAGFVQAHGHGVEIAAEELRALPPERWIDRVLERMREAGVVGESFDAGQLRLRWEVMQRNTRAMLSYVPAGRLPLSALLFRAADRTDEYRDQPFLGWERWLAGPIAVVDVPGGHLDVFQEPAVETVARGLRDRATRMAGERHDMMPA